MPSLRERISPKRKQRKGPVGASAVAGKVAVKHLTGGPIKMASTPYTEADWMLRHDEDLRRHRAEMDARERSMRAREMHERELRARMEREMIRAEAVGNVFAPSNFNEHFRLQFTTTPGEYVAGPARKSDEQVQAEIAALLGEAPKAVATEAVPNEMDEYLRLAEQLGMVDTKALANIKVRRVMQQLEVPHYPWDKVCAFLTKLQDVRRDRNSWGKPGVWAWLRVGASTADGNKMAETTDTKDGAFLGGRAYEKDIPLFVVRRAAELQGALGKEKCTFYASELDIKVLDPFMVLRYGKADPVVFAHWDEPGFKLTEGEKEEKKDGEAA